MHPYHKFWGLSHSRFHFKCASSYHFPCKKDKLELFLNFALYFSYRISNHFLMKEKMLLNIRVDTIKHFTIFCLLTIFWQDEYCCAGSLNNSMQTNSNVFDYLSDKLQNICVCTQEKSTQKFRVIDISLHSITYTN